MNHRSHRSWPSQRRSPPPARREHHRARRLTPPAGTQAHATTATARKVVADCSQEADRARSMSCCADGNADRQVAWTSWNPAGARATATMVEKRLQSNLCRRYTFHSIRTGHCCGATRVKGSQRFTEADGRFPGQQAADLHGHQVGARAADAQYGMVAMHDHR